MIRHALKLMWNRKRQNALVVLEIVGSFLVLFALSLAALATWSAWQRPVGFDPENLWIITAQADSEEGTTVEGVGRRLIDSAEEHAAVERAALTAFGLYSESGRTSRWLLEDGRSVFAEIIGATRGMNEVLRLQIQGRWFEEGDRQDNHRPIVINRAFAKGFYGELGEDFEAQGQIFAPSENDSYRIVGLVEHFRKAGELASERPMFFEPMWPEDPLRFGIATLILRMQPGSPADLEQKLIDRLRAEAPGWSFDITRAEDQRAAHLRLRLAPLAAGGTIAAFLLAMVGLGLTGVLWQNVTRRTREIGLRRAQGATAADVRRQIVLELLVLAGFGVGIGAILAAQLPNLGLLGSLAKASSLSFALALTTLALFALTLLCGLYPSWLATRILPAEALHQS